MKLLILASILVISGVAGISNAFSQESETWENIVTTSNEKVKTTLATDKKEYSEGETIHIQWSLENVGTKDIFFKPTIVGPCKLEFDIFLYGSSGKYYLKDLLPIHGISSEPQDCTDFEYAPVVSPNKKFSSVIAWTQDIVIDPASLDGIKKITPGRYTLQITYYESEQQYNDDRPDTLSVGIIIERTSPTEGFFVQELDDDLEFFHKDVKSDYYDVSMNYWTNNSITINDVHANGFIGSSLTIDVTALEDGVLYLQPQDELGYLLAGGCPADEYTSNSGIELLLNMKFDGEVPRYDNDYLQLVHSDARFLTFGIFVQRGVEEISLVPPIGMMTWGVHMQACADKITPLLHAPYQQMKNDVSSTDVMCKQGFKIVKRTSNNFPTCVKASSVAELEERGWGTSLLNLEGIVNACRMKGATNFDAECP